jgi:hypothetical protein
LDINCTYECLYQVEGKCCLTDTPHGYMPHTESYTPSSFRQMSGGIYENDCPYQVNKSTFPLNNGSPR